MNKLTKCYICIVLVLITSVFFSNLCYANNKSQTIRVAILDNPNMPPKLWTWLQYEKVYLRGIETAKVVSKKYGINIVYKTFFYGTEPLDVLNEIPKVEAWNPDIILGPHYSNQFLLLKNHFSDVLVLTSYASDKAIDSLPSNFHSLFPPDRITVKSMATFIDNKFPSSNIFIINRIDCKACNDISELFSQMYHQANPMAKIKQNNFIGESDNITDVGKLLDGYHQGDVIVVLAVNLYNYTDLIIKISSYLHNQVPIFISLVDNWGKPAAGLAISNKMNLHFEAYLVNPLFLSSKSESSTQFYQNYMRLYDLPPDENVSYMTYMTLMSVVDALNQFPENPPAQMKEKILLSYQAALKNNPNWFRPSTYAAYRLDAKSGKLVDKMDMTSYLSK